MLKFIMLSSLFIGWVYLFWRQVDRGWSVWRDDQRCEISRSATISDWLPSYTFLLCHPMLQFLCGVDTYRPVQWPWARRCIDELLSLGHQQVEY